MYVIYPYGNKLSANAASPNKNDYIARIRPNNSFWNLLLKEFIFKLSVNSLKYYYGIFIYLSMWF